MKPELRPMFWKQPQDPTVTLSTSKLKLGFWQGKTIKFDLLLTWEERALVVKGTPSTV